MSKARITKGIKKMRNKWIMVLQLFIIAILFIVIAYIFFEFFRYKVFKMTVKALQLDSRFLFILMVNVFVVSGFALVAIYQWAEREKLRFKLKQRFYRSMLVSPDYYRNIRRVNIDDFVGSSINTDSSGKLQIDHNLKHSDFVVLDDGRLHEQARLTNISYKEGKLHGDFKTYFSNGNILAEVHYAEGKLYGRSVVYYPNGSLHTEKTFKNGKLDGVFRAWDEDGALFFEIQYRDDAQHGSDKIYRKNGTLEYEDAYSNGIRIKRKTFDDLGHFKYVQKFISSDESYLSTEESDESFQKSNQQQLDDKSDINQR